jgi:uracil-DNA glycosylase family 4
VSRARELLRRYLDQRAELGEPPLILERPREVADLPTRAGEGVREGDGAADPRPGVEAQPRRTTAQLGGAAPGGVPRWLKDAPQIPEHGLLITAPPVDLFTDDPLARMGLEELAERVRGCRACELHRNRTHAVPGEGPSDAKLAVVGEGPGATEDATGRPFVGRAGELLTEILAAIDLPREQVFICNVVKCRPPSNRKPLPAEIEACVPYLHRQLAILRPAVILAMGGTAAETLLNTRQSLGSLRGKVHEFRGIPLVVTYHPAALLRNPHWKKPTWDDVRIARQLVDRSD